MAPVLTLLDVRQKDRSAAGLLVKGRGQRCDVTLGLKDHPVPLLAPSHWRAADLSQLLCPPPGGCTRRGASRA